MEADQRKKIDEEWDLRAQADRENVAEQNKDNPTLPDASFMLLLAGTATQAYIQLGEIENPLTKTNEQNLGQAKYTINTIKIIEDITKGNISEEESKYMENLIYDLRSKYLQKVK